MKYQANCKINMGLNIVGKREDGYHLLEMIMVPIDLADSMEIRIAEKTELKANYSYIPTDERNTIIKAINKTREKIPFEENFLIDLIKKTPTQAGLGGGSSDAAVMIQAVNKLANLQLGTKEMEEIAAQIGADVPFFIENRPAVVSGIGEILEPFEINCDFDILLVKPKWGINTKECYQNLQYDQLHHPDIASIKKALETDDYQRMCSLLDNDLENSSLRLLPEIGTIKKKLMDFGFDAAVMSGSGSTVFAITRDKKRLTEAEKEFSRLYPFVKKTKIINTKRQNLV